VLWVLGYGRVVAIPSGEKQGVLDRLIEGEVVSVLAVEFGVSAQYLYRLRQLERKRVGWKPDRLTDAYCQAKLCRNRISQERLQKGAVTCSVVCRKRMRSQKKNVKRAAQERAKTAHRRAVEASMAAPVAGEATRRGSTYRSIVARPDWVELLLAGGMTHAYVAEQVGCSQAAVSRSVQALIEDQALSEAKALWERSRFTKAMLPVEKLMRVRELGPKGEGTDEFECLIDELVRSYSVFSRRVFLLEGRRPLIEDFHLRWIRSMIVAYAVGGKQLILSPPRHGKSEMLIRFVVWMIVMFPNIRIMWVAANSDVAKLMLGAVKDYLENHDDLRTMTLPPGDRYKPIAGSGKPWSSKEIKVAQQDHIGQKSSSMLALGRTSKILSRDVDILIVDDLEDYDSTREPSQREYSRNKFAEVGTRKEEHTAWINICSRQHDDDIPHHLMKLDGTPQAWRTIEDTAHQDCQLDPDVVDGHDENGCVLFPAVRSYRWLLEKQVEMDALGIAGAYEMRYLGRPIPQSGVVFNMPLIREQALDRSRDLGVEGLAHGRLVAGLDPAPRGTQAGFCWHYAHETLTMVDLEEQKAGGFQGAWDLMRLWDRDYGLKHWFYEANSQQSQFFDMPETKRLIIELGLVVKPHYTGTNKQDAEIGISSMAPWYHGGRIILPYGTAEARGKVNRLLRQLELWTTDGVKGGKNRKTDIKMSHWFPFPQIIKWGKQDRKLNLVESIDSSYPSYDYNQAPWPDTNYPGR